MKRGKGCNLAAGIIEIVYAALLVLGAAYIGFVMAVFGDIIDAFGGPSGAFSGLILYVVLIALALGGVCLAFGIVTIKTCGKKPDEYYQKSTSILVFSIIETVMFALMFAGISEEGSFVAIALLASIVVLHWIGFALMKKGSKQVSEPEQAEVKNEEIKEQVKEVIISADEGKVEQLAKLLKLKKSGAITEEEFEILKKEILK